MTTTVAETVSKTSFAVGDKVTFKSNNRKSGVIVEGAGVIEEIKDTTRGLWFVVRPYIGEGTFTVRHAMLKAA